MSKKIVVVGSGAEHLGIRGDIPIVNNKFANGEINFQYKKSVRGKIVNIIQSFPDTNNNIMELMLMIDAAKRAGASAVNVLLTIFPYSRQDKKHDSGTPISAKVVCEMLCSVRPSRVVTIDLHATQIQGFMPNKVGFDHINSCAFLAYHLKKQIDDIEDWVFCSPDIGAVKGTLKLGGLCGAQDYVIINKTRKKINEVDSMDVIGEVGGRKVLIFDDIIDTAGTLECAMKNIFKLGASDVAAIATHGVFSGPAFDRLKGHKVYVTNTLPISEDRPSTLTVFNIDKFVLNIINRLNNDEMLSPLFEKWEEVK